MKNKTERGEVVVEASIVVTLVMIVITAMLYVGMVLYQQTLVSVMANQTAANIAQVYGNNLKDPFTGYVDSDRVYQSITYSNMKTDAYMDVVEQKANVFAKYRLRSSRILATGNTSVEIDIVKKPNELLKSQIVVTIRDSYDVPLVGMFGTNGLVEFGSTGKADCVDVIEYINGVEAVGDPEHSNVSVLPDAKNCIVTFIPDQSNPAEFSTVTVWKGKSILSSNRYTHCVMPSNPTKENWEFAGWKDESGRNFTASTAVDDNMVVYGSWKCTVTLHAAGGKVKEQDSYSIKTAVGTRVSLPDASKENHTFGGWYTEQEGKGIRYLSNDTVISGDVTLYAHWLCAHPSREEYKRTGNVCDGGTIYYRCTVCYADMGTGSYGGGKHEYSMRCDVKHYLNYFSGAGSGGCKTFHYKDEKYLSKNTEKLTTMQHTYRPYMYCVVCKYCHQSIASYWCGYHGGGRLPAAPSNGHRK